MPRRNCDIETAEDFRRYYDGWVGVVVGDTTVPLKYHGNDGGNLCFYHLVRPTKDDKFTTEDGKYKFTWKEAQDNISFGCPPVGMVQNFEEVLYGSALAERHSSRGLRLDRVRFHDFNRWPLRAKLGPDLGIHQNRYDIVWQVFNPEYLSLHLALAKLTRGETVGEALSRHLALYTLPDKLHPILAYKRWTIGYLPSAYDIVLGEQFRDYQEDLQAKFNIPVRII